MPYVLGMYILCEWGRGRGASAEMYHAAALKRQKKGLNSMAMHEDSCRGFGFRGLGFKA